MNAIDVKDEYFWRGRRDIVLQLNKQFRSCCRRWLDLYQGLLEDLSTTLYDKKHLQFNSTGISIEATPPFDITWGRWKEKCISNFIKYTVGCSDSQRVLYCTNNALFLDIHFMGNYMYPCDQAIDHYSTISMITQADVGVEQLLSITPVNMRFIIALLSYGCI